ncbi:hypothetical protein GCM10017653_09080 [Ancylobacter defluvii]|uniref:Uncharacterized protein n=1 Tax=Ancylobacter defluvii TaxID=1282440 RepID=A0A9W6N8X7_9HYPH|nr:hypothetical protein GCM10017653_09080 [Ancylobacter defluvii]
MAGDTTRGLTFSPLESGSRIQMGWVLIRGSGARHASILATGLDDAAARAAKAEAVIA